MRRAEEENKVSDISAFTKRFLSFYNKYGIKKLTRKIFGAVFTLHLRVHRRIILKAFIEQNNLIGYENQEIEKLGLPTSSVRFEVVYLKFLSDINNLIPLNDQSHYDFCDIGCGTGISSVFVEKNLRFKSVTGYELSSELTEIAQQNKIKSKAVKVNFHCMDAKEIHLKNEPVLVYLFNPFNEQVLKSFLDNNYETFLKNGSVLYYVNAVHKDVLSSYTSKEKQVVDGGFFENVLVRF